MYMSYKYQISNNDKDNNENLIIYQTLCCDAIIRKYDVMFSLPEFVVLTKVWIDQENNHNFSHQIYLFTASFRKRLLSCSCVLFLIKY